MRRAVIAAVLVTAAWGDPTLAQSRGVTVRGTFGTTFAPAESAPLISRGNALFAAASVRWFAPTASRLRPFAEGGLGLARLSLDFTADFGGDDITDLMTDDQGNPIDLSVFRETVPIVSLGGGVAVALTRPFVGEVVYRHFRIDAERTDSRRANSVAPAWA